MALLVHAELVPAPAAPPAAVPIEWVAKIDSWSPTWNFQALTTLSANSVSSCLPPPAIKMFGAPLGGRFLPPVIANDVGIIYSRSSPLVVAFFGSVIEGPYAEAEDRIGRIAQRIVDYFDGAR